MVASGCAEKDKHILHPAPYTELQVESTLNLNSVSLDDAELRVISPRGSCLCHSTSSVRLWGERSRRQNNSKQQQQQQSQSNVFAVAVIVLALGRSQYFISFPSAS